MTFRFGRDSILNARARSRGWERRIRWPGEEDQNSLFRPLTGTAVCTARAPKPPEIAFLLATIPAVAR